MTLFPGSFFTPSFEIKNLSFIMAPKSQFVSMWKGLENKHNSEKNINQQIRTLVMDTLCYCDFSVPAAPAEHTHKQTNKKWNK